MGIREDFQKYTNKLGFVSNAPAGSSGNDLLFSCEAALIRRIRGAWTEADEAALQYSIATFSRIEHGLYGRPGWKQDAEQPDDIYGLCAYSPALAKEVLAYGRKHLWYFYTAPGAWYDPIWIRFPAFIAHVTWAAGETPGLIPRLAWFFSVSLSPSKSSQDSWILSWLLITVAGNKGWLERWAADTYRARLKAAWGTIGNVFAAYFGNPDHPIAKYAPEVV